jgi:hypothetical protein
MDEILFWAGLAPKFLNVFWRGARGAARRV